MPYMTMTIYVFIHNNVYWKKRYRHQKYLFIKKNENVALCLNNHL